MMRIGGLILDMVLSEEMKGEGERDKKKGFEERRKGVGITEEKKPEKCSWEGEERKREFKLENLSFLKRKKGSLALQDIPIETNL